MGVIPTHRVTLHHKQCIVNQADTPSVSSDLTAPYGGGVRTQTRVGPMVAAMLRATGRTTTEAATILGVHRNSLAEKIAGRRPFTEEEIITLAGYFGVAPGQLFNDPVELLSRCRSLSRGHQAALPQLTAA